MIDSIQLTSISGASPPRAAARTARPSGSGAFAAVLQQELCKSAEVRFSAHAAARLTQRNIELTAEELARLEQAVDQVAAKGARASLILMDRVALVVSVPNRTVITALPTSEVENTVFTNIDSAIVAPKEEAPESLTEANGPVPTRGGLDAAERPTRRIA